MSQKKTYQKKGVEFNVISFPSDWQTREGYTFDGWDLSSTASAARFPVGSKATFYENTILYAIWRQNGGGGGGGDTPEDEPTIDTSATIVAYVNGTSSSYSISGSFPGNNNVNLTNVSSVQIGDTVTEISNNAFENCTTLTTVEFRQVTQRSSQQVRGKRSGTGLTRIGDHAFRNCVNLSTIAIPDTCQTIGVGAFEGCSNLGSVYITGKTESEVRAMEY